MDLPHKKISDCLNINSVNPLYLGITLANGYTEDKGINKYLVFNSTDENKGLLSGQFIYFFYEEINTCK